MLLFESRFKQREREVTLVTTVGLLTQSNSSLNTPDIKTIFFSFCVVIVLYETWASLKQLSSALAYVKLAIKTELTIVTITLLVWNFM